jgi:hypothetical protein
LGAEHTSTLDTINNLGNLYNNQGKMTEAEAEAEAMYLRRYKGTRMQWEWIIRGHD